MLNNNQMLFIVAVIVVMILIVVSFFIGFKIGNKENTKNKNIEQKENCSTQEQKILTKQFGKPKLQFKENHTEIVTRWINNEITAKQAAEELQISRTSLYKYFGDIKRATK